MPTLGIITFHTSHNEGAVLQSLALSRFLSGLLPDWRVEVVDLYYATKQAWYRRQQNARGEAIEAFARAVLPLGGEQFVLDGHRPAALDAIVNRYDAVVYGSDEIWKLHYHRLGLGTWRPQSNPICPPFPNAYWPHGEARVPKIAYAVSIGGTIASRIPGRHRAMMRDMVRSLALIGLRDEASRHFVEWLDPSLSPTIVKVPDPTFSVSLIDDETREAVRDKLARWGVDFTKEPVAVLARSAATVAGVLDECRARGRQTVALTLPLEGADVDLHAKPLTPVEWMAALGLFSACVSERMHACVSCLLGGTPVVALDYQLGPKHQGSKLQDLFGDLGLSEFHHAVHLAPAAGVVDTFTRAIDGGWPADRVTAGVAAFRQRSRDFGEEVCRVVA